MNIIGIDPGKSGAIAVLTDNIQIPNFPQTFKLDNTEQDIYTYLVEIKNYAQNTCFAYIEKVHTMPKQGIVSAFTFGKNYGFLIGLLTALKIPYEFVSPQKWQKAMGCLSKGDKNVTKRKAQELFPNIQCTHAISDSLIIAEFGRRKRSGTL